MNTASKARQSLTSAILQSLHYRHRRDTKAKNSFTMICIFFAFFRQRATTDGYVYEMLARRENALYNPRLPQVTWRCNIPTHVHFRRFSFVHLLPILLNEADQL
jgi:hypothetical protein